MAEQSNADIISWIRREHDFEYSPLGRDYTPEEIATALEAAEQRVKEAVSQRNRAYRQRDEEREAKEGNIRALNRLTDERDRYVVAMERLQELSNAGYMYGADEFGLFKSTLRNILSEVEEGKS